MKTWHKCRPYVDPVMAELAALERRRQWLTDQIAKIEFAIAERFRG
jgi:hypothetical protein